MPPTTSSLLRLTALRSSPLTRITNPSLSSKSSVLTHQIRPLSSTHPLNYPRKDSQDRESINTEATEYSKSGSDDSAAAQTDAAFDSTVTDPKKEKKIAGEGQEGNPLEVSPANPEVSKPRGEQEGGAEKAGENKKSGAGSGPKNG